MAPTDEKTEVVLPAEVPEDLLLPSDPKVIFLGGLAVLVAAYVASDIVLPLVFAIVLKLLLQPALRILEGLHIPRTIASLLLILALLGTIVGLGTVISGPARTWAAKLPEGIPRLQERLSFMREPIDTLQRFLQQVEDFGGTEPSPNAATLTQGPTLLSKLFTGVRHFASGFFTTVLFLFFLLVSGDIFLHRLVEILPRFRSKRQVVEISQQIESDVSAYLVTITIMNAAVGIATALAMWLTGVGDPILWGTVAFLLNYVPILGTAMGVLIFLLAGLLTHDTLWLALLPAGLYFGFHLIEGETVTPMLLARRFTLNPVLVIISLAFWFWSGVFRARSSRCPCWRLLRSYATVFSRWQHSVFFLRGETSRFLALQFGSDCGGAVSTMRFPRL
jgi:predicted PurR-regulated permease PerM